MPLISVIMPVRNVEQYVALAIQSVIDQTLSDFELIIIDDGSTDNTSCVVRKYCAADERIVVLTGLGMGIVDSLNRGLSVASGQFIARMDGDDVSLPHRFRDQLTYLERNPSVVAVGCQIAYMNETGSVNVAPIKPLLHIAIDRINLSQGGAGIMHPTLMARAEAIAKVGGYREQYRHAEDGDLLLRLAEHGALANLPDVLLNYRKGNHQVTCSQQLQVKLSAYRVIRDAGIRRNVNVRESLASKARDIAWCATDSGQYSMACRYVCIAFARDPLSLANWLAIARVMTKVTMRFIYVPSR